MRKRLRRMKVSVTAFSFCVLALLANPQLVFGEGDCNLGCTTQCPPKAQRDRHCQAKCHEDSDCVVDGCDGILDLIDCPETSPG